MVPEIERSTHDAASIERDTPAACPGDLGDQGVSVEPTKGAADLGTFLFGAAYRSADELTMQAVPGYRDW